MPSSIATLIIQLLLYAAFALCFVMRIHELASPPPQMGTTPTYPSFDFLACLAPFLCTALHPLSIAFLCVTSQLTCYLVRWTTIVTLELLPLLRHHDRRPGKNDRRNSHFLFTLSYNWRRLLAKFCCVLTLQNPSDNCRLDGTDGVIRPEKVMNTMAQAILQSPDFEFYDTLRPPYGIILFYLY